MNTAPRPAVSARVSVGTGAWDGSVTITTFDTYGCRVRSYRDTFGSWGNLLQTLPLTPSQRARVKRAWNRSRCGVCGVPTWRHFDNGRHIGCPRKEVRT